MIANLTAALGNFHFERSLWLLAIFPAIGVWLAWRRLADPAWRWRGVIAPELLPHLMVGAEQRARMGPATWALLASIIAAIAVAGPAWRLAPSPFAEARPPVAVVLRAATSMQEDDLAPSRLDRARQKLADILAAREGAATALVAFAGSAHLVLPPTADSSVTLEMAKAISPQIMPRDGDDLAGALALANRALAGEADGGAILVLADELPTLQKAAGAPVVILALRPPGANLQDMQGAARQIDARLIPLTVDQTDVAAVVRALDAGDTARAAPGEGERWRDEGYWLVFPLALLTLLWFRRGWVLS